MKTLKKLRIESALIFLLITSLTACVSDEFNLNINKVLNTDISVGGDSLTITLAKTNKIL